MVYEYINRFDLLDADLIDEKGRLVQIFMNNGLVNIVMYDKAVAMKSDEFLSKIEQIFFDSDMDEWEEIYNEKNAESNFKKYAGILYF